MKPLTLDTGALIAMEGRRQRVKRFLELARDEGVPVMVPAVCVAEWWRGRTDRRERILRAVVVQHTDHALMRLAGEAQAALASATCIDAIVMATAARHGGTVLTSDVDDMLALQAVFPTVRVLGV